MTVFLKMGMDVRFGDRGASPMTVQEMADAGVRRAYLDPDNKLRASIAGRSGGRAEEHERQYAGGGERGAGARAARWTITVAAKGGGSEAKAKFAMLNPSDSVVEWVLKTVPTMGAGWCPPGMLGIGIGGTAEKAMLLAKRVADGADRHAGADGARAEDTAGEAAVETYEKVNRLGIGAQGLGGLTTVLDVKMLDYPTHAANLPVAMIPNCAATRHAHLVLDGAGPVYLRSAVAGGLAEVDL